MEKVLHINKENTRKEEEATTVTSGVKREKERPVVIPNIRGLSKELKRTFGGFEVPTYFKPTSTLRRLLVHPVGKDKFGGQVYKISCEECEATYMLVKTNVH